MADDVHIVSL